MTATRRPDTQERSWADQDESFDVLAADGGYGGGYGGPPTGETDIEDDEDGARRHPFVVIGLPLLALAVVVALAWWVGSTLLDVTDSVDDVHGSTPSASASASGGGAPAAAGKAVSIAGGDVFDPQGDGDPDNAGDVPLAFDGDTSTSWSTYEYRGSPAFGNLKDGVGLLLDLGTAQKLAGVTLTTSAPGATVEIRTGDSADGDLDAFAVAADGKLQEQTALTFDEAVSARYVLVWITGLVQSEGGFSASVAEVAVQAAG